ncbi:MAG: GAF domain-containing protein, partial [Pseudomonadota bacterium]
MSLPGQGLAGLLLEAKAGLCVSRYGDLPKPQSAELMDDTAVGAPIIWRSRVIGTFCIGRKAERPFANADLETLDVFARHAAIAINNAQSYERERKRAVRLHAANKIGAAALSSDVNAIIEVAAQELEKACGPKCSFLSAGEPAPPDAAVFDLNFTVRGLDRVALTPASALDREDHDALPALVRQLGLLLERARLAYDTRAQLGEMRVLYETGRQTSTAMDLHGVVRAYLTTITTRDQFQCDIGLIERDAEGNEAFRILGRWRPSDGFAMDPVKYSAAELELPTSMADYEPLISADVHADPAAPPGIRRILQAG